MNGQIVELQRQADPSDIPGIAQTIIRTVCDEVGFNHPDFLTQPAAPATVKLLAEFGEMPLWLTMLDSLLEKAKSALEAAGKPEAWDNLLRQVNQMLTESQVRSSPLKPALQVTILDRARLVEWLETDRKLSPVWALATAAQLLDSHPRIQRLVKEFIETGEAPVETIAGLSISKIQLEWHTNTMGALHTLNWLMTHPDEAYPVLTHPPSFIVPTRSDFKDPAIPDQLDNLDDASRQQIALAVVKAALNLTDLTAELEARWMHKWGMFQEGKTSPADALEAYRQARVVYSMFWLIMNNPYQAIYHALAAIDEEDVTDVITALLDESNEANTSPK